MKLLITGESGAPRSAESLKNLHNAHGVAIYGDQDIQVLPLDDGGTAVIAGVVSSVHSSAGSPITGAGIRPALKSMLGGMSPAEVRASLAGRFFIVVFSGSQVRLFADRFGRFDMYLQDGRALFASDSALLESGNEYDQHALAHALAVYGNRPPKKRTIHKGLRRLGVGEAAFIEGGQVRFEAAAFKPAAVRDYNDADLNRYTDYFLDSLKSEGSSESNLVFLSSGWDSTSILGGLVHVFGKHKVRAVIGRMQYSRRAPVINQFEIDRASAIAKYYDVPLDIVEFDYRDSVPPLLDRVKPIARTHNFCGISFVNQAALIDYAARTKPAHETVFAGEISDGAHNMGFCQFASMFHPVLEFREYADKMHNYLFGPNFVASIHSGKYAGDPVYKMLREAAGSTQFDEPAATREGRNAQLLESLLLRGPRIPLVSPKNVKLLSASGHAAYLKFIQDEYFAQAAREMSPETVYSWYLHIYNSFHWQGGTVATLNLIGDAFGVNVALPYYDHRIQGFLSAMPETFGRGLDLNPTKYPLKWMLKNRIDYPYELQRGPHSYLYDVDHSFSHYAEITYGSAFAPLWKGLLQKKTYESILSPDVFDMDYVSAMVKRYLSGEEVRGQELTDLLSLASFLMVQGK